MRIRNALAAATGVLLLAGAATLSAATGASATTSDTTATTSARIQALAADNYKMIRNAEHNQCVDAPGGLNLRLKIRPCNPNSATQRWGFVPTGGTNTFFVVNKSSGLCMEVNHGTSTPGETVDQFTCDASTAEQWVEDLVSIDGTAYFHLRHSGTDQCLDTVSGPGSDLMQWTCDRTPIGTNKAQGWTIS